MIRTDNRNRDNGFTLIEVLLGAMLMSTIALSVYWVFSQGLKVERRLRSTSSGIHQNGFWSVYRIAQDLENAARYTPVGAKSPYFKGGHRTLSFLIINRFGLRQVRYSLRGSELVRMSVPFWDNGGAQTSQDRKEETLDRALDEKGLEFFYLTYDDDGNQVWEEEWTGDLWPAAVRIGVTMRDQDRAVRVVRDAFLLSGGFAERGVL